MAGHRPALAIVGAGPRGTSVLERLCASFPELAPGARLTVHVVDPCPPGAGRVWRTTQPPELLMNTVASQVTLFTDPSVTCEGPIRTGPSLYEWMAAHRAAPDLGPDDYPPRALYGRYLEWVFAEVVRRAPAGVTVRVHAARAVRLQEGPGREQVLTLEDGRVLRGLAAVVLAQGHLPVAADRAEAALAAYADGNGLRYYAPANPADLDLSPVAPGEPVLLRGLGLNFFDHMALLTAGRGGAFVRGADGALVYRASGREPRLYAGSRRGIPYHARGDNAKGAGERHEPMLLTPDVIALFRKRAAEEDWPDFRTEIWPLVAKEVETIYYETLLRHRQEDIRPLPGNDSHFRDRFLAIGFEEAKVGSLLDAYGIPAAQRWSWEAVAHPYRGAEDGDFRSWLLGHLRADVAHARRGNVAGPVKAALDVLRDLRNELRRIVDHGGLSGASRRADLDRWYTPLNAFLSIGPPRRRIEEMTALIEAGVLDVLGPGLRVTCGATGGGPGFEARSERAPGAPVVVTTLIEARLPEPDLRRTADALLADLLRTGQCRAHRVGAYETGGLDVTPSPYRLLDRAGRPHPRRFAIGVPTEGVHWVTAAGARPGVNSVTLSDADAVARAVLRVSTRLGMEGMDQCEGRAGPPRTAQT